jgi:predicted dienelactone hydrolase
MQIDSKYKNISNQEMHAYLLGQADEKKGPRYIADIMAYTESNWIIDVLVPNNHALYGQTSGKSIPVLSYLVFPSSKDKPNNSYSFPYDNDAYGSFDNMLTANEQAVFAEPNKRYPLIILSHGLSAHGIFEIQHAQSLASHGYIVAVIFYGDDRSIETESDNTHLGFLRPLMTKAVLDSILESQTFGPHIDTENIGMSGHSFGGFTSLAMAGGPINCDTTSVTDPRITACVIAAPWVGGKINGRDVFAFGHQNVGLQEVSVPIMCLFGSEDESTLASFILPASKQLSGPRYVIELLGQPHIFEASSWEDRNNWELLFFLAYLKNQHQALSKLKFMRSITGGNKDRQLFDYQKLR